MDYNIEMLTSKHNYYTDYAIQNWNPKKEENLLKSIAYKKLKKKEDEKELKEIKQILKAEDPEKAIQSVFRVTLKNHIKLSDIADTKANILLSVNAIIISIAISNLIPKLDNASNHYLIIPSVIFMLFTVVSIILSVIATRPNVTSGKFTKEDVDNKKVNLLFFGNFHKMSLAEFEWAMNEMLAQKDYIYSSMTKDLYFLGLVLQRKYKILRLTYNIFMTGIIVSVISLTSTLWSLSNQAQQNANESQIRAHNLFLAEIIDRIAGTKEQRFERTFDENNPVKRATETKMTDIRWGKTSQFGAMISAKELACDLKILIPTVKSAFQDQLRSNRGGSKGQDGTSQREILAKRLLKELNNC